MVCPYLEYSRYAVPLFPLTWNPQTSHSCFKKLHVSYVFQVIRIWFKIYWIVNHYLDVFLPIFSVENTIKPTSICDITKIVGRFFFHPLGCIFFRSGKVTLWIGDWKHEWPPTEKSFLNWLNKTLALAILLVTFLGCLSFWGVPTFQCRRATNLSGRGSLKTPDFLFICERYFGVIRLNLFRNPLV